ncbi:MAG: PIN domain-containing protein [Brevundimonas sp.]
MLKRPKIWGWAIKVSRYTVILDACVLYPAPLRDFLMELAAGGLFRARWTAEIHDEWIRNVLLNRKDLTEAQLHRTRDLMNGAILDCMVEDYSDLIPSFVLPDPDDRHVLAAAIKCGADAIITFNKKDFPPAAVDKYGIEILHPDTFLQHQFGLDAAKVIVAAQTIRGRLKNPPRSVEDYLDTLGAQGLTLTVGELLPFAEVL